MLFSVWKNVRVLEIWSFVRYFLGIVSIIGFCDFAFFLVVAIFDTSILYSIFSE